MTSPAEEQFIHLSTCISRLHSALETFRLVKSAAPGNPLSGAAFRYGLVEYVIPFTCSFGDLGKYKLDDRFVPPAYANLHKRIISARHKVHAHADLTIMKAAFKATGTQANPAAAVTGKYIDELKELPNIDQSVSLVNDSIGNMYVESDSQLKALNP